MPAERAYLAIRMAPRHMHLPATRSCFTLREHDPVGAAVGLDHSETSSSKVVFGFQPSLSACLP